MTSPRFNVQHITYPVIQKQKKTGLGKIYPEVLLRLPWVKSMTPAKFLLLEIGLILTQLLNVLSLNR